MLDGVLTKQIRGDEIIAGMLAKYNKKPAFFFQKSPQDADRNWQKPTYPRVDYNIDMRYEPERKASGNMTVNVWCTSESAAMPEDIEKRLVELINGTFYTNAEKVTNCAIWRNSEAFVYEMPVTVGGNTAPEVFGVTMFFDLLQFPEQLTSEPDPIQGLNAWTREHFPKMTIIGLDELPTVRKPTDEHPVVYWRFEGTATTDVQSYAVQWYTAQFAAHVIAHTIPERNRWTKAIAERMQHDGEVLLTDQSPMFAKNITIRNNADPLREGGILFVGKYGVLRKENSPPLNNANFVNLKMEVTANGKK